MKHLKLFENHQENLLKYLTDEYTTINVDKVKECLKTIENGYHWIENLETYLGNKSQNNSPHRASHLIEQGSKLENIKGVWVYPYDYDYALNEFLLCCIYRAGTDEELKRLYVDYLLLNPEMEGFRPKTYGDAYYILMGMTSGYNFNDINSFLTRSGVDVTPEERQRVNRIEREIGMNLEYVPSVETIAEMEKQLGL